MTPTNASAQVPHADRISSGWGSVSLIIPIAAVPSISSRMPSNWVRKGAFWMLWIFL